MTSLSILLAARGPAHALALGLRGHFFSSGAGIFYDPHDNDDRSSAFRCVEALARTCEDEVGLEIDRRAPEHLTFHIHGPAFPGAISPDPWDDAWLAREERMRRARLLWDARYGAPPVATDAKKDGAIARARATRYDGETVGEREQTEAEARDGE